MAQKEKTLLFKTLALPVRAFMHAVAKYTVIDREKLPKSGPIIIAPNHYSEVDPLVTAVTIWESGRAPRFMAKAGLFRVFGLGWLLRHLDMIPVERDSSRAAGNPVAQAELIVEKGFAMVVYPEGSLTREPNLWPMRGKTGAARLALTGQIPVYPLVHWGTQELMPRYGKLKIFGRRTRITLKYGDPVDLSEFYGKPINAELLTLATVKIMTDISALLGSIRGETPPEKIWDPSENEQTETGKF